MERLDQGGHCKAEQIKGAAKKFVERTGPESADLGPFLVGQKKVLIEKPCRICY
ncbi:hypothetical protein GPEL0_01f5223 [Geoanaerobacter pelophilus]|uniref:Uncharacterized protein n=1 Tax=Geoanaerobacter pelophilus TaxID=60036 RepID=A0ABQ0MNV7_9BACT|nr:hypothetical protein GPEL0_01f5223 [Geoanaerobacter pelophilus]